MRETVGVLGGSFDPVHSGHLRIACESCRVLALSRVLLLPAALPPHKAAGKLTPAGDREAMLRLAVRGHARLAVSREELDRGGVCYTIDTLRRLRDGEPGLDPVFLLGRDSLVQLPTWRDWRALIGEFDLALLDRAAGDAGGGELHPEIVARLVELSDTEAPEGVGRGGRIFRLPVAPLAVSSSAIRARARAGEDLTGLVPPAVARYIHDMGLYGRESNR